MHCCLAAFYIDDFSYQENVLPRLHRELGHEVEIVASTETYLERVQLGYTQAGSYVSRDGIRVTRLPYVHWLPARLARKLRVYRGLRAELERFRPDVLFLHDCQFLSITTIEAYAREKGAAVYVDCHTDGINSAHNILSRHVLHGMIYRWCARRIDRVARRFYATLPLRAEFLRDVYGLPADKITLLPFGVDDSRIRHGDRQQVRAQTRAAMSIAPNELVFVTGGKIDRRKAIHVLADAFMRVVDDSRLKNAKLVIFGKPEPGLRPALEAAMHHAAIRWVDWVAADDIHRYLWAGDVAIFPGTHSVLWEEAVGLGVACVFRRWHGIEHVDLGGNCIFIDDVDAPTLEQLLLDLANDPARLTRMRDAASTLGPSVFSYNAIARRAIQTDSG